MVVRATTRRRLLHNYLFTVFWSDLQRTHGLNPGRREKHAELIAGNAQ